MQNPAGKEPRNSTQEQGSVLLEATLTFPLLVLLLVTVVDLGGVYTSRSILTQIAREGARVAAATPNLELQTCTFQNNVLLGNGCAGSKHEPVMNSIIALLNIEGPLLSITDLALRTTRSNPNDEVTVEISVRYAALFHPLQGIAFGVRSTARHL